MSGFWFKAGEHPFDSVVFSRPKFCQLQKFVDAKYKKIAERKNRDRTCFFVYLKSLVCLFMYFFVSDFSHEISVSLWYRNQNVYIY